MVKKTDNFLQIFLSLKNQMKCLKPLYLVLNFLQWFEFYPLGQRQKNWEPYVRSAGIGRVNWDFLLSCFFEKTGAMIKALSWLFHWLCKLKKMSTRTLIEEARPVLFDGKKFDSREKRDFLFFSVSSVSNEMDETPVFSDEFLFLFWKLSIETSIEEKKIGKSKKGDEKKSMVFLASEIVWCIEQNPSVKC